MEINAGKVVKHTPSAVLAPGTGLGEAFLIWNGKDYIACSSEGGHGDFAPTSPVMPGATVTVSASRAVTGPG